MHLLHYVPASGFVRTLNSVAGYVLRPTIISVFCTIIGDSKKSIPAWVLTGINAALSATCGALEN